MSDVTFGVKMPEELKNDLNKLIQDSGLVGKDFMQTIMNIYQVEKTKEQLPAIAEDLKELQGITQRINNIYLSLGYRIENITKSQQELSLQELTKKDSIIYNLQSKVDGLESEKDLITESYNNIVNKKSELNVRIEELTNMYTDNKALVEEYKDKNDMLTGMLSDYKKYPEQLETTKSLLADSQTRNVSLESSLKEKESNITRMLEDWENLKSNHKLEIENLKSQSDFNIEKALLNKDKADQDQINKINQENNKKIQELLHENQIHDTKLTEKISKLMEDNQLKANEITAKDAKLEKLYNEIDVLKAANKIKK